MAQKFYQKVSKFLASGNDNKDKAENLQTPKPTFAKDRCASNFFTNERNFPESSDMMTLRYEKDDKCDLKHLKKSMQELYAHCMVVVDEPKERPSKVVIPENSELQNQTACMSTSMELVKDPRSAH